MTIQHRKTSTKKNNPYGEAMQEMEKKLSKSYKKLESDIKKHAPITTIKKDSHDLLIHLGECNYLMQECKKIEKKRKTQRKSKK
jgi:hypothetical protein